MAMAHRGDAEALRFGAFVQHDELGRADTGRCVRVLGRIGMVDTSTHMIDMEYRGERLPVDTTLWSFRWTV